MTDYFRRIDAMLALHSMPPEYQHTHSNIYCNDCEKKSVAKYHFLYHRCSHCHGYNSKVLSTFEKRPPTLEVQCSAETLDSPMEGVLVDDDDEEDDMSSASASDLDE